MDPKTLQRRLARSLDRANIREAGARPPAPLGRRCTKLSISLFDADLERISAIRARVLADRGVSITTSECIKLALRTVTLSGTLLQALDSISIDDGRKVAKYDIPTAR